MSIEQELEEWEFSFDKLELFTNRDKLVRLFIEYLNDNNSRNTILYLHGDGGNGKSLLLKFLQKECCNHFTSSTWQRIKNNLNSVDVKSIQDQQLNKYSPIPSVKHDFWQRPGSEDKPQDPFYGLLMLRRNLASACRKLHYQLKFPLYDFACIWYFHNKGKSSEEIKKFFPPEDIELISLLIDAVSQSIWGSLAKTVVETIFRHFGQQTLLNLQQHGLDKKLVQCIKYMDTETDLLNTMPIWLAKDLNEAMQQKNAPPRLVLFFDTHEAFWGEQHNIPEEQFFYKDEWLRRFLRALNLSSGIVVIVAGRLKEPRWHEAPKYPIPHQYIDRQNVEFFSPVDAELYLQKAEITDTDLVRAVINYASVVQGQVHPFYLALCTEVVYAAKKRSIQLTSANFVNTSEVSTKSRQLLNSLLRYVNEEIRDAVYALSACRAFNYDLYQKMGAELNFSTTNTSFRILTRFSFVWQDKQNRDGWYQIHELLRRLNYENNNLITREAHQILENHYREQGNIAEAIYHANRYDDDELRSLEEWVNTFDIAVNSTNYDLCRVLLEVKSELLISYKWVEGRIFQAEGTYLANISRYDEAKEAYLKAVILYDQSISLLPDNCTILNFKGNVLIHLGDLHFDCSEYAPALQNYEESITILAEALNLIPDSVRICTTKANALRSLANLKFRQNDAKEALKSYKEALKIIDHALSLDLEFIDAYITKTIILENLGNLLVHLNYISKALTSYNQAVAILDLLVKLNANNFLYRLKGLSSLLVKIGIIQCLNKNFDQSLKIYQKAINICDQALVYVPNDIQVLRNKGEAFAEQGHLLVQLIKYSEAQESYQKAIITIEQAISIAPFHVPSHINKAEILGILGKFKVDCFGQVKEAKQDLEAALDSLSIVVQISQENDYIRNLRAKFQNILDKLS